MQNYNQFNIDKEAQEAIETYLQKNDIQEYLKKYKSLYPVYLGGGKVVLKYCPSVQEYIAWEASMWKRGLLNKAAIEKNREKYKIEIDKDIEKEVKRESSHFSNKLNKAKNIAKEDTFKQAEIFKKLFDTDKECFVRIRCASTGKIYSYNVQALKNPIKLYNILNSKKFTKEDLFYSIATYKTMTSGEESNIFSMHIIPVDIDFRSVRRFKKKTPMEVFNILEKEEFERTIPTPTVVEVGHQLRFLYKIECVGATRSSRNLVKRIGKIFSQRLVDYGADVPRLTDSGRIHGSINSKSCAKVETFFIEDANTYTLNELRDKWLDALPEWYFAWKSKSKKVIRLIPKDKDIFYSINKGRIEDFYRIANYFCENFDGRRFLCFQVRNHAKLMGMTDAEAEEEMRAFNNKLARPLAWRVIERDTRNVNRKQYLYKDITILDYLGLDKKDVEVIGLQELKYQTDEEKKVKREEWLKDYYVTYNYKRYRNTDGLTKTEVRRMNEFITIAKLELQGMSLRGIAIELGKSVSTLSEKINKRYKKINYNEIREAVFNGKFDDLEIRQLA